MEKGTVIAAGTGRFAFSRLRGNVGIIGFLTDYGLTRKGGRWYRRLQGR